MKISLSDIRSNYQGFSRLVELEDSLEKISGEPIEIDMRHWYDRHQHNQKRPGAGRVRPKIASRICPEK